MLISFSGVYVKWADTSPEVTGFYRAAVGAVVLLAYSLLRERQRPSWQGLSFAALGGLLFFLDLALWHKAILLIGVGMATLLGNFQVFFMAAFGHFFLSERTGWKFLLAVLLALAGLYLMVGVGFDETTAGFRLGVVYALTTAVFYAAYMIALRKAGRIKRKLPLTLNMAIVSFMTAILFLALALWNGDSLAPGSGASLTALAAYGVLSQAIGWLLIASALPQVKASLAGLVLLVQPTLAFVWDVVLFSRSINAIEGVGVVLALTAILMGTTAAAATKTSSS